MFNIILASAALALSANSQEVVGYSPNPAFPEDKAIVGMGSVYFTKKILDPYIEYGYRGIDRIPKFFRRPFERTYGLLLDNLQVLPELYLNRFTRSGNVKSRVIPFIPYDQTHNGCGETAAAMLLKNAGYPITLGQVDTQFGIYSGMSGAPLMELRRRGFMAVGGSGSLESLRYYISKGYPVVVSVNYSDDLFGHVGVTHGDNGTSLYVSNLYTGKSSGKTFTFYGKLFDSYWEKSNRFMFMVSNTFDPEVQEFFSTNSLRRTPTKYSGVYVSDFWYYNKTLFLEKAYSFVSENFSFTSKLQMLLGRKSGIGGNVEITSNHKNVKFSVYLERLPRVDYENLPFESIVGLSFSHKRILLGYDGKAFQGTFYCNIFENFHLGVNAVIGEGRFLAGLHLVAST